MGSVMMPFGEGVVKLPLPLPKASSDEDSPTGIGLGGAGSFGVALAGLTAAMGSVMIALDCGAAAGLSARIGFVMIFSVCGFVTLVLVWELVMFPLPSPKVSSGEGLATICGGPSPCPLPALSSSLLPSVMMRIFGTASLVWLL